MLFGSRNAAPKQNRFLVESLRHQRAKQVTFFSRILLSDGNRLIRSLQEKNGQMLKCEQETTIPGVEPVPAWNPLVNVGVSFDTTCLLLPRAHKAKEEGTDQWMSFSAKAHKRGL